MVFHAINLMRNASRKENIRENPCIPLPNHCGEIRRADGGPPQGTAHARESHSATIDEN